MSVPRLPHPPKSLHLTECRYTAPRPFEHAPRPRTRPNIGRPTSPSILAHACPRVQKLGKEQIEVHKFDQHAYHVPLRCRATVAPATPHRRDSLPAPPLPKFNVFPRGAFYYSTATSTLKLKDATELVDACNTGKISYDEAIKKTQQMINEFKALGFYDPKLGRKGLLVLFQLNNPRLKKEVVLAIIILLQPLTIYHDIKNAQFSDLLDLERLTISEIQKRDSSSEDFISLIFLYLNILTNLWLYSIFSRDKKFATSITDKTIFLNQAYQLFKILTKDTSNKKLAEGYAYIALALDRLSNLRVPSFEIEHEQVMEILQMDVASIFLGRVFLDVKDYTLALGHFDFALNLIERINNKERKSELQIEIFDGMGSALRNLGEYRQAIDCHNKQLALGQSLRIKRGEVQAYFGLGCAFQALGNYNTAIDYFEKSLSLSENFVDHRIEGVTYGMIGHTYMSIGDYRRAIEYTKKGLIISKKYGYRREERDFYANLASIHLHLGEFSLAIDYFKKSLVIFKDREDKHFQSSVYNGLGCVFSCMKKHPEAIIFHQRALNLSRELVDLLGVGEAYHNLGNSYESLHDFRQAIKHYEEGLSIFKAYNNKKMEGRACLALGYAYKSMKNYQKAVDITKISLAIAYDTSEFAAAGAAHTQLGICYIFLEELEQAEKNLRSAIKIESGLQEKLGDNDQWQISLFEQQALSYLCLVEVLIKQGKISEALCIADFGKSRALVNMLARKHTRQTSQIDLLTEEQICSIARKHSVTIVFYTYTSGNLVCWVVSSSGGIHFKNLERDQSVEEPVKQFYLYRGEVLERNINQRSPFDDLFSDELYTASSHSDIRVDNKGQYYHQLHQWHKIFIEPIQGFLPSDPEQKVMFISDERLHNLPFALLLNNQDKYLIERHTIFTCPSIKAFEMLNEIEKENAPKRHDKKFNPLIVSNPTEDLPYTILEAQEVQKVLGGDVLIGKKATVLDVSQKMNSASWIHFACHGSQEEISSNGERIPLKLNYHSVFQGALQLAPIDRSGKFFSENIQALSINPELVFMSACKTGQGSMRKEGVVGLTRAFHIAGASSVISTYWPLDDSSLTISIVNNFYLQLKEKKSESLENRSSLDKAKALRHAMLGVIQNEPVKWDPRRWGAFFLSGLPS
jgi:CHAT domain-containing protein/tetratricopeptide (TPR) repeat protein